jgi:hypothetical protein
LTTYLAAPGRQAGHLVTRAATLPAGGNYTPVKIAVWDKASTKPS